MPVDQHNNATDLSPTLEAVVVATTTQVQDVSSIVPGQVRKCRHLVTGVVAFMPLIDVPRLICRVLIVAEWVTYVQNAARQGEVR